MHFTTPNDAPATERDIALDLGARDPSWGDAMGAHIADAWDMSLFGRAADSIQEQYAQVQKHGGGNWLETQKNIVAHAIPKEEWPQHEHYREGIEWDERMDPIRAKLMAEDYDERRAREAILAKQTPAQMVAGFGVQMGVGLTDPVNYIPFIGQARTARMIGRMGSIGGRVVASGIDAGLGSALFSPLMGADLNRRGEDFGFDEYAFETLVSSATGMLFGGASGAWAKHFRGETKAGVLKAAQAATLAVEDGRPVDVAPMLKDVVEAGQFNRDTAMKRLTDGGLDVGYADSFLTHLDGLAAAQGMDVNLWVRRHVADIEVGGEPSGDGIRFHAAMYRSPAKNLPDFLGRARATKGGKPSFMELGSVPDALNKAAGLKGKVVLTTDAVHHVDGRHPEQADEIWGQVMRTLKSPDTVVPGTKTRNHKGDPFIIVKTDGDRAHAVIIEDVRGKKGARAYISTSFEDNAEAVNKWVKRQVNREEASMGAGGDSSTSPIPDGKSHINASSDNNIHYQKAARKALEQLQSKAKNAQPLKVVDSFDDLPEHIKGHVEKRGVEDVRAVNDGKDTYVVASALGSEGEAVKLWLHEQAIHTGLRGLVGDNAAFNKLMDSIFDHFGADTLEGIRVAYGLDFSKAAHRREAAEEALAHLAEKMEAGAELSRLEVSAWEDFKQWFRDFLRKQGVKVELTDADITGIIKGAVRWTMGGSPGVSRRGPQRFALDGKGNGSIEFLPDGRARVRLFEGADLDQAGAAVSKILAERFEVFPPKDRLDWRVERPERDVVDAMDSVEPEEVVDELFAREAEEVDALMQAGRLTEEEIIEIQAAERGVEQAGRMSEAFKVAAECIVKGSA